MKYLLTPFAILTIGTGCATNLDTPHYETSMLQPVAGYEGNRMKARVTKVENDTPDGQRIELMLPAIGTEVTALTVKDADGNVVPQRRQWEVINDPDANRQGVIIYLDRKQERPFKINFNDQPEY